MCVWDTFKSSCAKGALHSNNIIHKIESLPLGGGLDPRSWCVDTDNLPCIIAL